MNRRIGLCFCCVLLLSLSLALLGGPEQASADSGYPFATNATEITTALDFLRESQRSDGSIGGFTVSSWVVMAIAAAGEHASEWSRSATSDTIVEFLLQGSTPASFEPTDWARMILAIVAAGEEPTDFGGVNYVAGLKDTCRSDAATGYTQIGYENDLHDDFWGVMALVAADESVERDIIEFILYHQNDDGGWSGVVGAGSDTDNTTAAIMALAAAGEDTKAAAIVGGLEFLQSVQNADGGFPLVPDGVSNAVSDSWAILAIVAAGNDPSGSMWVRSGNTPVSHLLSLRHSSGYFERTPGDASMEECMTAYAIAALLGNPYPIRPLAVHDDEDSGGDDLSGIAFAPSYLSFAAVVNGRNPREETLEVWNSGTGTLRWAVDSDVDWLTFRPSHGDSTGEKDRVTISAHVAGLDAGEYNAFITVSDDDDSRISESVTVTLTIEGVVSDESLSQSEAVYLLVAAVNPAEGGTISESVAPGLNGYASGTTVMLTATASPGYAFARWSGDAEGSEPSASVVMSGHRNVIAEFLRFDASGLGNVSLAYACPGMTSVNVIPYPVENALSNPPGFLFVSAYIVQPEGSGSFSLRFDDLGDTAYMAVFQVVGDAWVQVPCMALSNTALQVAMSAHGGTLALAYPGSSSANPRQRSGGFFGSADSSTIISVLIIALLVAAILVIVLVYVRRDSY